jgi:biotin synthase
MSPAINILQKPELQRDDIIYLLLSQGAVEKMLFEHAAKVKTQYVSNSIFLRGLIEFSNICHKNCLYCGIRSGNAQVKRYHLTDEEILRSARYAHENNYGSIVLQSGEVTTRSFILRVEKILQAITQMSTGKLRITLSCGEQQEDTYKRWYENGAHRYLLRIETSNRDLYARLHPDDENHRFQQRMECLYRLRETGYQVGTGVMIGLPFQTTGDLADDLLFMKNFDIDMVGMGPYLEHIQTPLFAYSNLLQPAEERLQLTLKMIALLRIIMKDINIAATTAMQAVDPLGREKAIKAGANVIMPNITPGKYRNSYLLYQNKPCTSETVADCLPCLEARIALTGNDIAFGEYGDSRHFLDRL